MSVIRRAVRETRVVSAVMPKSKEDAMKTKDVDFVAKGQEMIAEDTTRVLPADVRGVEHLCLDHQGGLEV